MPPIDRRRLLGAALALPAAGCAPRQTPLRAPTSVKPPRTIWTFDNLDAIGGLRPRIEGAPTLIDSPFGKAVQFDGVDDALFIDRHPLAGASTFTFEALFRPDGGAFEQRWFHLQSDEPEGGPGTRILFEIRVVAGGWYLDAFAKGPGYNKALIDETKLHPLGVWTHVAQTFDGTTYRSWVNGVLQAEAPLAFTPQPGGRSSVGVRINRVNYFNGAVREARFNRAYTPPEMFANPFR